MLEQVEPIILPYESQPAACREYDPRCAVVAQQVATAIRTHLTQLRVEHVGSSAVPGCAGKNVIDLLIPVPDGEMENVKLLLQRLGFQPQPGPEPFPEERPMRVGSVLHEGQRFLLHVHAIPDQLPEVDDMRFFRSCLRADPELVRLYVARKREILAGGTTDSREYARLKGEFIRAVLG